ncbi:MAG: hypothetical protein E6J29_02545 [Chloroflexi bacterium]|nr:MAG: hypothetical protein E6J29_02545 [Chloroflexota bacterium]
MSPQNQKGSAPSALQPHREEGERPNWLVGERPEWLAAEQPKKKEWSPARDRMEAELELKARLSEQRRRRRRNYLLLPFLPLLWIWSLLTALVEVGRNRGETAEIVAAPPAAAASGETSLLTLPSIKPAAPVEAPPSEQPPPPPAAEAPPAPAEPAAQVEWPEGMEAPPPSPPGVEQLPSKPDWDWRPKAVPRPEMETPEPPEPAEPIPVPPEWAELVTAAEAAPKAAPAPEPYPTIKLPPVELARVILETCLHTAGAEVGVLALLQDDILVVRSAIGLTNQEAGELLLDTMGEICLDVIASLQPFHAYDDSEGGHDALHPRALLAAPLSLAGAGAGVVLLTSSVAGREFTDEHEQLVSAVATNAGPTLVDAGGSWRSSTGRRPRPRRPPSRRPPPRRRSRSGRSRRRSRSARSRSGTGGRRPAWPGRRTRPCSSTRSPCAS